MIGLFVFTLVVCVCLPAAVEATPRAARALWVWDTARLLDDVRQRDAFVEFCEKRGVTMIWAYVATHETPAGPRLSRASEWKDLLASAHARGMEVHALDGDPHYALRTKHNVALATIDAVVAYNASVSGIARFDGIHFDIEPYLLDEWKTRTAREQLLAEYLELNERAAVRSHENGLAYGIDMPFWWGMDDESTGEPATITVFRGVRRPALDRLLEIVDVVGLMNYRTSASGPDGIIELALPAIGAANSIGKARIIVGVETERVDEMPEKVSFAGKGFRELAAELVVADAALRQHVSYGGVAVHRYSTLRQMADSTR